MKISIEGLSKGKVLAALYNAAKPQGLGFLHYDPTPMTEAEADEILKKTKYFDYLKGRVMKIDLVSDTEIETDLYDRDNGNGCAYLVIRELHRTGETSSPAIDTVHTHGVEVSAARVKKYIAEGPSKKTVENGITTFTLGVDPEIKEKLEPAIEKALKNQEK